MCARAACSRQFVASRPGHKFCTVACRSKEAKRLRQQREREGLTAAGSSAPGGKAFMIPPHDGWRERAACADADPDLWFPSTGQRAVEAREICRGCPVQIECLHWALVTRQTAGIWGGVPVGGEYAATLLADVTEALAWRRGRPAAARA